MMSARDERGFATIWVLSLCIVVLMLGGLVIDFWRVLETRRDLSAMADAAAAAGGNGIDETALRSGRLQLDVDRARQDAWSSLLADRDMLAVDAAVVAVDGEGVRVVLRDRVRFGLGAARSERRRRASDRGRFPGGSRDAGRVT